MLEKTVLQQLQEIFPMEVNREQADTLSSIFILPLIELEQIDYILKELALFVIMSMI